MSRHFDYYGGQYILNGQQRTYGAMLQSTVADLNATINVKPKMRNRKLELTGVAKPVETHGLTGTGPGLASQESAGWVVGQVWNRTDPFLRSKPGPLAGYPDPLLTLSKNNVVIKKKLNENARKAANTM